MPVAAAGSFASRHATHLLAVAIPVAMVVIALVADSVHTRRKRSDAAGAVRRPIRLDGRAMVALWIAALASVGAAAVHLRVLPEHAEESAWYGAFFAAAALAQLGVAAVLVRRAVSRRFVALCAAGNVAVIGLWLFTRLVAVPIGPSSGSTEAFGALDIVASVLEAVVAAGCLYALAPKRGRAQTSVAIYAPARVG